MVYIIDRMLDWTGRACGLPMQYWMYTNEKGDASDLQVTVLRAVRVVFKKGLCQFAPVPWCRARDDVFYFPEAMFMEVDKQSTKGFGAHVWASMYNLDPQVAEIVSHRIQVTIAQYVLGRRSHFGSYSGLSLQDKSRFAALTNGTDKSVDAQWQTKESTPERDGGADGATSARQASEASTRPTTGMKAQPEPNERRQSSLKDQDAGWVTYGGSPSTNTWGYREGWTSECPTRRNSSTE